MKTELDHLPLRIRRQLDRLVALIHEEFEDAFKLSNSDLKKKGRIEKIVLYGSFARGGWVERDPVSGYQSDFDILLIVSHKKIAEMQDIWTRIEHRADQPRGRRQPVNIIAHTMREVNEQLKKGQYFFSDIVKEGVLLDSLPTTRPFAELGVLDEKEAKEIAKDHFEYWFQSAEEFRIDFQHAFDRGSWNKAAFELHQCVERLYTAVHLTLTNYRYKTHNIEQLRGYAEEMAPNLIESWPRFHRRDRRMFDLLRRAYVEARYSRNYRITREELLWLKEHMDVLTGLVRGVDPIT